MYKKVAQGWMKHFDFLVIDLICLQLSYFIAYCFRNGFHDFYEKSTYRSMSIIFLLVDIILIAYFELFKDVLKRGYYKEWTMMLKHVCLVMLFATFYLFISKTGGEHSRIVLVSTGVTYFIVGYTVRIVWKKIVLSKNIIIGKRSLLILTTKENLNHTISEINRNNYGRFRVSGVAVLDKDMTGQIIDGVPVIATKDTVINYICRKWVDEVFIQPSTKTQQYDELINQLAEMGVTVHINLLEFGKLTGQKQLIEQVGPYMVLTTSINITTDREYVMKRSMDVCGGIVGCLVTGVLFLIFAPLIYIKSPGPIFFSQTRIGQNGKKFKIYKFRSMYLDAEERKKELMEKNRISNGMMFKLDYDPRIIGSEKGNGKGIGNFIRKYSIDEFPQFWNVLKGDMSLVGTRPPTVDEWEKYALHHRARLAVKPGITGAWQVSGRSDITDFEEVVKLDTNYILDWSVGLDLRIIAKTILVVLGQNGAL